MDINALVGHWATRQNYFRTLKAVEAMLLFVKRCKKE